MKLKEKLAFTYAKKLPYPYTNGTRELIADDFLAGFEKAREMSAKIAYGENFDGTGDEIDFLGEEEVE